MVKYSGISPSEKYIVKIIPNAIGLCQSTFWRERKYAAMDVIIVAEGDFRIPDDSWKNIIMLSSGSTLAVQVFANGGEIWTYNGSTWNTKHSFKDSRLDHDKVYHLTVVADTGTDKFSVYLDVELLENYITEKLGGVVGEEYAQSQNRINVLDEYIRLRATFEKMNYEVIWTPLNPKKIVVNTATATLIFTADTDTVEIGGELYKSDRRAYIEDGVTYISTVCAAVCGNIPG